MNQYVMHNGMLSVVVGDDPEDPDRTIIGYDGVYESVPTEETETRHTKDIWINTNQINALSHEDDVSGARTRITMSGWHFDTTDHIDVVMSLCKHDRLIKLPRIT